MIVDGNEDIWKKMIWGGDWNCNEERVKMRERKEIEEVYNIIKI